MSQRSEFLCPSCKSGDNLSTIETMRAEVPCEAVTEEGPEYMPETKAIYDSSEITGVKCKCGFEYLGDDWKNKLA